MAWKVISFQSARGTYPVEEFLATLDYRTQMKVAAAIKTLEYSGPHLKPPYMKKLTHQLYELRIKSQVAVRIFYSSKSQTYYLLHAFKKKTQRTPDKELKIALDRLAEIT